MFESFSNIKRMQAMQSFLPNAWNYFNKYINDIF